MSEEKDVDDLNEKKRQEERDRDIYLTPDDTMALSRNSNEIGVQVVVMMSKLITELRNIKERIRSDLF